MEGSACPILFVLGPSGVGKSSFAAFLASKHRWLHLEIDQYRKGDGIDFHGLRAVWDLFFNSYAPAKLVKELRKRTGAASRAACVLSFPSGVVLSPEHIEVAARAFIDAVYLYGSAAHCINAFLRRERSTGRNLGLDHWARNNWGSYAKMSVPAFEPHRIHMFSPKGNHRPHAAVYRQLCETPKC